jgi:hypothetical protein
LYPKLLISPKNKTGDWWDLYVANFKAQFTEGGWDAILLKTKNQNSNLLCMLHDFDNMWYSLFYSHSRNISFYQDSKRAFFIDPKITGDWKADYELFPFYHPYTDLFIEELNHKGITGFLNRNLQLIGDTSIPNNPYGALDFDDDYIPTKNGLYVNASFPNGTKDIVDFTDIGAYSPYNWELFFHAPLYIANKLFQNQKYEEAMNWFHYIFNPTDKTTGTIPQKFWITKPFFKEGNPKSWETQMKNLLKDIKNNVPKVQKWINNPFNPHLIARTRTTAFQKTVVMKYLDNLIGWADHLFRQDTMESNSEATLLYMLAYEILGKRPIIMPENSINPLASKCYDEIKAEGGIYAFLDNYDINIHYEYSSNQNTKTIANMALTSPSFYQQESGYGNNLLYAGNAYNENDELPQRDGMQIKPVTPETGSNQSSNYGLPSIVTVQQQFVDVPHITNPVAVLVPRINPKTFCVPYNEHLLRYWDTVEDRLFKLRHCMNIDGLVRELPLFAPPIDPAMLVKAAAAGLSIADAMNEINAQQPYYRFRTILQKAIEFTNEVKQFGDKLLSALEKKDAEVLSVLRNIQEINMQQAMKQVRKLQIEEAKQNIVALAESIKNTEARKEYYGSKELMNKLETTAYGLNNAATIMNDVVAAGHVIAAIAHAIPNFSIGVSGVFATPVATAAYGGGNVGNAINAAMTALSQASQCLDKHASLLLTKSSYQRRKEEWDFQAQMANMEINQLNKQQLASEIRLMVAEKELENMELQIEQSQSVNEYYNDKFTNEQLYNWMITEISKVYLNAYKLAYDMAKKAELCYRKELGIYGVDNDPDTTYIQFGHWDSLKKGLLAGDRLIHALHRLDAAYVNKNKRNLELTKHISLAEMFPGKLIELITKKHVEIDLQEYLFDMDYPGHYMRRIKSVAVTIPNVAGPHTTVSCMLNLNSAKVRLNSLCGDPNVPNTGYVEDPLNDDLRFNYQTGGDMICTSSAQNDSGMFELNFGDERYLPFENAGAISKWGLCFPAGCDQFDLSTVSDVILHINYTSAYDGVLALKAKAALQEKLPEYGRVFFSLKHEFSAEWGELSENNIEMNFALKTEHLPFFLRGKSNDINVANAALILISKKANLKGKSLTLTKGVSLDFTLDIEVDSGQSPIPCGDVYIYNASASKVIPTVGNWKATLGTTLNSINPADVEDIIIGFNLND